MPRGRPSKYTDAVAEKILLRLAEGETLISICRDEGMPAESTVRSWVLNEPAPGFSAKYAFARELGYQRMADEIIEIADDGSNDWMERNDEGNTGYVVNGEHVQRSRLRLDTRKWLLSKALPKVYGDKVIHAGDADNPIRHVYEMTDEALLRIAASGSAGTAEAPKGPNKPH